MASPEDVDHDPSGNHTTSFGMPIPPPSHSPAVALSARYSLSSEIGRGGMGAVLRAHDPLLERDLAVKVLLEEHRGCPEREMRFVAEARIGGRLQHPGVAPVYDLGRLPDQRLYFAMKLVDGQGLDVLLCQRPNPAAELPRFLAIFEAVCQTIAFAHSRRVVHRDLKPGNVMVGAFGEVQVMDWGLAKPLTEAEVERPPDEPAPLADALGPPDRTPPGAVIGTPAYVAPEQALGLAVDERADVFGLGAMLCEILTGKPPYVGRYGGEVLLSAAAADQADALRRLDACGADAELVSLTKRCLAANRDDRPANARAVADAVAAYLGGVQERLRAAELEKAAAQARAVEERKRRLITLTLAATVLLVVLGGGGGAFWLRHQRAERDARLTIDVDGDLRLASERGAAEDWPEAQAALQRARGRVSGAGRGDLEDRIELALADLRRQQQLREMAAQARDEAKLTEVDKRVREGNLVEAEKMLVSVEAHLTDVSPELSRRAGEIRKELTRLQANQLILARIDEARLQAATPGKDSQYDNDGADDLFHKAFCDYGLDPEALRPAEFDRRLRSSGIREELLVALESWSIRARDKRRRLLSGLIEAVDDNPWRRRFRQGIRNQDRDGLLQLADEPGTLDQVGDVLVLLGESLKELGRPDVACKVLRRGLRRRPGDFWLHFHLGVVCEGQKPPLTEEALRCYTAALALRPRSVIVLNNQAAALMRLGQAEAAVEAYQEAIRIKPDYASAHWNQGLVLITLERPIEAEAAFRKAMEHGLVNGQVHRFIGIALYHQGRYAAAVAKFREALKAGLKGQAATDVELQIIALERMIKLEAKVQAILAGKAKAKDEVEALELAHLCVQKQQHAAAVRFYKEAFRGQPDLGDDVRAGRRWRAACSAAQAGCGKGVDAPAEEKERAGLRKQALSWLREDLDGWDDRVSQGKAAERRMTLERLEYWQRQRELAGVRDRADLARLPEAERAKWEQFWKDVASLVRRCREG